MLPYWFLFFLAVAGMALFGRGGSRGEKIAWWAVCSVFALMIGLRHQVGGDWYQYLYHFDHMSRSRLNEVWEYSDPGYYFLNWLVAKWGGDIYWLNTICGLMVMGGLGIFCRAQPLPWLGLAVAVPYMITVVAMGYTRQAVALGFALVGLTYLGKQKNVGFVIPVLMGATFHKSAVLLLPIAALAASRSRLWTWVWVGVTTAIGAQLLLMEESERLWDVYVEQQMESQGGQIRVAMNAVPAALFLLLRRRLTNELGERRLWWWFAVFSMACVPLVGIASTAVDRVALYFIPLQVFVFSRVHRGARDPGGRKLVVGVTVVYYAAVLFVWLNYASHAQYWVPYQMHGF